MVATYFAAEPKPGVWSVTQRSLSIVLGIPIIFTSELFSVLGKLVHSVHGVVTADVKKCLYVVLSEAAHDFFVNLACLVGVGKLIAAGAQNGGRCLL